MQWFKIQEDIEFKIWRTIQLLRIRAQVSGRIAMNSMPCKSKSFPFFSCSFFFFFQHSAFPLPHFFELSHILFKKIRKRRQCGKISQHTETLRSVWSAFLSHKNRKRSLCTLCNNCLRGLHPWPASCSNRYVVIELLSQRRSVSLV